MTTSYSCFRDRHVIVTGAAAGIGRSIALAFHAQGARVSAFDRDSDGLAALSSETGMNIYTCDLADDQALREAAGRAFAAQGPAVSLINNAGVDTRIPFAELDMQTWRWMLAANLDHQMTMSQLMAQNLPETGGAIVNMSSTAWMKLAGNMVAYHAAKAGIVGLTRGLARDLGPRGVRVNAIAPGRVLTERALKTVTDEWISETKALQCLPELIDPSDIADTALWLASDSARRISGQVIVVDGGVV